MIHEHENPLGIPDPRKPLLEAGLDSQAVDIHELIVTHRAVDPGLDELAGSHRSLREVVPREQFFGHRLSHPSPLSQDRAFSHTAPAASAKRAALRPAILPNTAPLVSPVAPG